LFRTNRSVVGLDLGSSFYKAVELTRDKGDVILTGFARLEVTPETNRREAIGEVFRRGRFRTKRVVAAVSGKSVIERYVLMPKMSSEELKRSLTYELDKHLPLPPEDTQVDWQVLGDVPAAAEGAPPQMRVVIVGAKRSLVADLAANLVECGLTPVAIDVDVFALGNAFALASTLAPPAPEEERGVALVDVGASKTCIHIVAGGSSQFAREVPIGGNDFTAAISRRLAVPEDVAETLKREPGDRAGEVRDAVGSVLDELTNEVNLSIDYFEHQSEGTLDTIYLTGGSALASFLPENLERTLERSARMWNPLEGLQVKADGLDVEDLQAAGPSLAVALGLAARETGRIPERVA
jgi:type IV pilus assembly protein PilM